MKNCANYGIDAPIAIRNLIIAGIILPFVYKFFFEQLYAIYPLSVFYYLSLPIVNLLVAFSFFIVAVLMIYSSKIGKIIQRDKLLNLVNWQGTEQVLDAGCGRGLMLIGAAKKLTTGKATGVDIWQSYDLTGNKEKAVLDNAQIEQVSDRIIVKTANIKSLPFPDNNFDVIFSNFVIHNLYQKCQRENALKELMRVLKPHGILIIQDIRYISQYAQYLHSQGMTVTVSDLQWRVFPPARYIKAVKS